jgi:hypothetical protein
MPRGKFHKHVSTWEGDFVMKTDTYTKVVLTGIAIFLGAIAFDYKPGMKAEAGIAGGGEMIVAARGDLVRGHGSAAVWQSGNGKVRACQAEYEGRGTPPYVACSEWK